MNKKFSNVLNEKIDVFLRRVSTENQSLEMQMAADEQYRELIDEDDYIELNEIGVSANKVKLKDRDEMQKLISLIQAGNVGTLYVYDRSRLTRNFYEYLELVDLFIHSNIEIIFTSSAFYPKFSMNTWIEGFNGILIEAEGKSIERRMNDLHNKLPPRKFGYDSTKLEDGGRIYKIKESHITALKRLFADALKVSSFSEFTIMISSFHKIFNKDPLYIVKMLSDAFYAGHERLGKRYNILSYVEPVIPIDKFLEVQEVIQEYTTQLHGIINERNSENILTPICSKCKKVMVYRRSKIGDAGRYTCSNGHQKIEIDLDSYNNMLVKYTVNTLKCLDKEAMQKRAIKLIGNLLKELEEEIAKLNADIEHSETSIALLPLNEYASKDYQLKLDYLKKLRKQRNYLNSDLLICYDYKSKVSNLINKLDVTESLTDYDYAVLIPLIVKNCYLDKTTITLELYFNEYLNPEKIEEMVSNG